MLLWRWHSWQGLLSVAGASWCLMTFGGDKHIQVVYSKGWLSTYYRYCTSQSKSTFNGFFSTQWPVMPHCFKSLKIPVQLPGNLCSLSLSHTNKFAPGTSQATVIIGAQASCTEIWSWRISCAPRDGGKHASQLRISLWCLGPWVISVWKFGLVVTSLEESEECNICCTPRDRAVARHSQVRVKR